MSPFCETYWTNKNSIINNNRLPSVKKEKEILSCNRQKHTLTLDQMVISSETLQIPTVQYHVIVFRLFISWELVTLININSKIYQLQGDHLIVQIKRTQFDLPSLEYSHCNPRTSEILIVFNICIVNVTIQVLNAPKLRSSAKQITINPIRQQERFNNN